MATCSRCGELHPLTDISLSADSPLQWDLLSDVERERSELTSDQCVIESTEGRHFFVRACLHVPLSGSDETFTWGVWASLSEASFLEMSEHWSDPGRSDLGPYSGWLCTKVPEYPDTMFLKTMVHQRSVGTRPAVELEPTDHPLSIHQRQGIAPEEMQRIVETVLHQR
jgi:hypothetical protein